jgi:hypothetical protein
MTEAEDHEYYEKILRENADDNALADFDGGSRVILGLRKVDSTAANDGRGIYNDRFVVLRREDVGCSALVFAGNTDPSSFYEDVADGRSGSGRAAEGKDADGDGRLDLGRVPAGSHQYRRGNSTKFGDRILRSVRPIHAERDVNHDGVFDESDAAAVVDEAAMQVTDFLFHPGLSERTGSAGCQTLPPDVFDDFWTALGDQNKFWYVLVEV